MRWNEEVVDDVRKLDGDIEMAVEFGENLLARPKTSLDLRDHGSKSEYVLSLINENLYK